jgi:hypothetical protein
MAAYRVSICNYVLAMAPEKVPEDWFREGV